MGLKHKLLFYVAIPVMLGYVGYFHQTWIPESIPAAIFGGAVGYYIRALETINRR